MGMETMRTMRAITTYLHLDANVLFSNVAAPSLILKFYHIRFPKTINKGWNMIKPVYNTFCQEQNSIVIVSCQTSNELFRKIMISEL